MGCCKGPDCTHWDEIDPETSDETKSAEPRSAEDKPTVAEQQQQQQQQ